MKDTWSHGDVPSTHLAHLRELIALREARLNWVEHQLCVVDDDMGGTIAALMGERDHLQRCLAADRMAYDELWLALVQEDAVRE